MAELASEVTDYSIDQSQLIQVTFNWSNKRTWYLLHLIFLARVCESGR